MVMLLLAVTIVLGVTGCSKKLTQKSFVSALKSCDIEENDKLDILKTGLDGHGITKSYYVAEDEDEGETGTKSKVTYYVDSGVSADGKNNIGTGIYLQGNTVIFLRTIVPSDTDYEFADKICGKLGLISPSEV